MDRYPLAWPEGWPRTPSYRRKPGLFHEMNRDGKKATLTMVEAMKRVMSELEKLNVSVPDDVVISTNLRLNLSGLPRGDQGTPQDPGVAVYFQPKKLPMRVIAIDAYTEVKHNLAAVAATLEAMRKIERHGGAQVMERAFTGFDALPAPKSWAQILGVPTNATPDQIKAAHRAQVERHHPDRPGGSHERMAEINAARDEALRVRS